MTTSVVLCTQHSKKFVPLVIPLRPRPQHLVPGCGVWVQQVESVAHSSHVWIKKPKSKVLFTPEVVGVAHPLLLGVRGVASSGECKNVCTYPNVLLTLLTLLNGK